MGGHAIDDSEAGVRSVQRALAVLAVFDEKHTNLSAVDLARAVGLPKTTTVRLVKTLEHAGLLWSRADGRITIGVGLLRWARLAQSVWQLPEPARDIMRELSLSCSETVNLYVRQGLARVCIAQHEGTQTVRNVVRLGDDLPLWCGAAARVLLSDADPHLLAAVSRRSPYGPDFATTLSERVRATAQTGWAESHGEREAGASGIAAPILTAGGRNHRPHVRAALALGGPTSRFTPERVARFVPDLVAAAARISALDLDWPVQ